MAPVGAVSGVIAVGIVVSGFAPSGFALGGLVEGDLVVGRRTRRQLLELVAAVLGILVGKFLQLGVALERLADPGRDPRADVGLVQGPPQLEGLDPGDDDAGRPGPWS